MKFGKWQVQPEAQRYLKGKVYQLLVPHFGYPGQYLYLREPFCIPGDMPDFYKTHAKEDCPRTGECGWLVIFSPLGMGREQFEGSKTLKEAKREAMRLVIEKLNRIIDSFKDVKV